MPKVSIIVPAIYRPDLTQVCINSIISYTKDYELILVQEGEDPKLKRLMTAYKAKYIQNKKPKGYSGALNTGLEQATGEYICFMNNDTVAVPGWMDEMLECFKENPNTGLVCPTFWGSGGKQSVDWGDEPRFDYVDNIFGIIGVCFVIPRKVLNKIGSWDESYGHGGEDFDICHRIQKEYDLYVARRSFIYHYGGASTRIVIGNDIEKTTKNQMDKLKLFSEKHNISMEDIMDKINLNNKV
jgi:O-antigen biosynthesis protein